MVKMVPFEGGRRRHDQREIGHDAQQFVVQGLLEAEIMGDFVHPHHHGVIGCTADDVEDAEVHWPRHVLGSERQVCLQEHRGGHNVLGLPTVAKEFLHLGIFRHNELPTRGMWLVCRCPVEILLGLKRLDKCGLGELRVNGGHGRQGHTGCS
uniref:Uncharacterized protein n=1 Tax=Hyaloperonospora arabidopsidis (strain Emoy2) TaxID=559515 RepID=M4BF05_HYAAE